MHSSQACYQVSSVPVPGSRLFHLHDKSETHSVNWSKGQVVLFCVRTSLFICSWVEGHLSCFHVLAILNKFTTKMCRHCQNMFQPCLSSLLPVKAPSASHWALGGFCAQVPLTLSPIWVFEVFDGRPRALHMLGKCSALGCITTPVFEKSKTEM